MARRETGKNPTDPEDERNAAAKRALRNLRREAGRASLGDVLPEDRRASPAFMVSIGLGPSQQDDEEEEEEIQT